MNPCVKTEEKCNESVNNEFKIMRKRFITSNNESEQIIKQAPPYSCLFNYFFNSLF